MGIKRREELKLIEIMYWASIKSNWGRRSREKVEIYIERNGVVADGGRG